MMAGNANEFHILGSPGKEEEEEESSQFSAAAAARLRRRGGKIDGFGLK